MRTVVQVLVAALLLCITAPLLALEVPSLTGRVNDLAGVLGQATVQQLEEELRAFETAESTQLVVLTIPSLEGDSLEGFSLRVVEAWKIGQSDHDNGALLLIVKNDRKLRIEVGYGLEGKLTDLVAGRIIREIIRPRFQEGRFDQGIRDGLSAMMEVVKGEFPASPTASSHPSNQGGLDSGALIVFILIAFSVLGRVFSGKPMLAAGIGASLAPVVWFLFLGMAGGIGLFLLLMIVGFIFGLMAASSPTMRGGGHGGGFISGGGYSGGYSGGFSGGGGSFGGGGASGGW